MLFSKRDVANLLRRKLKNGLFGSSCGRSRKCNRYSKSEKRKATTAGSDNIISNPKALLQGFILTQCQDRNVTGQYSVRRNRNIRFSCTFDAENGDAELPADIQLANAFPNPRLRHFYFKDGVLFIDLYIVKNMVGSEANRSRYCQ